MTTSVPEKFSLVSAKPQQSGRLDIFSLISIMVDLHVGKNTGFFRVIKTADLYCDIFFEAGEIRDIRRHPVEPKYCLGRLFHVAGRIEPNDVAESFRTARDRQIRQGQALLNMGKVTQNEVEILLLNQMELKFTELMTWSSGTWEIYLMEQLPSWSANVPLDFPRFIFRNIFRHFPDDEAQKFCLKYNEHYVNKEPNPPFLFHQFTHDVVLQKFWEKVLSKESQVKRVFIISNRNMIQTARMIAGLHLLRMIRMEEIQQTDVSLERAKILAERLLYIDKEDYFSLLTIHWSCNEQQLKEAWKRHEKERAYNLSRAGELEREYLDQFHEHLKRAYEFLLSDENRQKYRAEVFDPTFIEFNSEIWRLKAESYLFTKNDPQEAYDNINIALEIWRNNPEYYALKGLSMVIVNSGKNTQMVAEGKRTMNKALAMSSKNEVVLLCEGLMYKFEGKTNQAAASLEKALAINPDNKFIRLELHEVKTGQRQADMDEAVRAFVNRKNISEEKIQETLAKKPEMKKS